MDLGLHGGTRVAFFGGSFDPPHLGHLGVARAAQAALGLDTVLFAPVGAQPLKPRGSTAGFEDRLAMTRLAIAADTGFAVSLADAPMPSGIPNYTLETLLRLHAELQPEGMLFCLMGADSFAGLRCWHRGAEIPFVAPLIVASRPGERLDDLKAALPAGLEIEAACKSRIGWGLRLRSTAIRSATRLATARLSTCFRGWKLRSARAKFETNCVFASTRGQRLRAGCRNARCFPVPFRSTSAPTVCIVDLPLFDRRATIKLGERSQRMANVEQHHQQTRILVQAAAAVCEDKKGEDTRILELDPIDAGLSDFFLVTSASNDRQAIAIADEIEHRLKKEFGVMPNSVEGRRHGEWILLDYVDFVVHVFLAERRAFYDIERLRKSARPLTPAEFDAELKAALAKKTVAARKKATVKAKPAAAKAKKAVVKAAPKAKKAVKAVAVKAKVAKPTVKKAAVKKIAAKSSPVKKVAAKKATKVTAKTKKK
jgi:ribosome-associated protein